jgi:hypothetical protein
MREHFSTKGPHMLIGQAGHRGQAKNIGAPNPLPRGLHFTIKPSNARGTAIK